MKQQMNDPFAALVNIARSGGSPLAMLQQMAGANPQAAQAMQMIGGKSPQQLRQMAENMAKERGTTIEEVARSIGLNLPR